MRAVGDNGGEAMCDGNAVQFRWVDARAMAPPETPAASLLSPGAGPGTAAVAGVSSASGSALTADAVPTVQVNGIVRPRAPVGDAVCGKRSFPSARPTGSPSGRDESPLGSRASTTWLIERRRTPPALQTAGQIGLRTCLSGSATSMPAAVLFDDSQVIPANP